MQSTHIKQSLACTFMLLVLLSGASPAAHAAALSCPDYFTPNQAPALQGPAKKGFRYFWNTLLSRAYSPYHMIHDELVPTGKTVAVTAKFDYDKFLHKDLEGEYVHAYFFGTGMRSWQYLGKYKTNSDGKVTVSMGALPTGDYRVRMIAEGDLSEAEGFVTVFQPGRKSVLFDIDGTLTLNDFEAVGDYLGISNAQLHGGAEELVWAYIEKGYQIIYLTGRQYWLARSTRQWFNRNGLIHWHLKTDPDAENPASPKTEAFKTNYISGLRQKGLNIVRAYGNAETDISAYAAAGIAANDTWIIGENAGEGGTHAIEGDYRFHLGTVVADTPHSGCL